MAESPLRDFAIRPAVPGDMSIMSIILSLIRDLAEYERLLHEVEATEECLGRNLFGERQYAEPLIGELRGEPVAFAVYFHNFSTFLGKRLGSIWKTCSSNPRREVWGSAERSCGASQASRSSVIVVDWIGRCWIGTRLRSRFTSRWVQFRWAIGRFIE
jgi:hypothetical protein